MQNNLYCPTAAAITQVVNTKHGTAPPQTPCSEGIKRARNTLSHRKGGPVYQEFRGVSFPDGIHRVAQQWQSDGVMLAVAAICYSKSQKAWEALRDILPSGFQWPAPFYYTFSDKEWERIWAAAAKKLLAKAPGGGSGKGSGKDSGKGGSPGWGKAAPKKRYWRP
ncbi:hypothetical protein WJX84_012470 [Apatococcus fuscideae]|uniref:Uncharacterized protein n=1 Tax=Apatococcus fuscideae TaxID=2026836 RepID=A0AAW1T453_9CHLO